MAYFLGIDGGGSQTTCALADDDRVLVEVSAGSAKPSRVGAEQARGVLQALVRNTCAAAGLTVREIGSVCFGAGGAGRLEVAEQLRGILAEILDCPIEITGDMAIAYEAAFADAPGVVVIAGTGSIAYGKNERGETGRAGGWGPLISDEGSGDWIGRRAIAEAMRARDAGNANHLIYRLCQVWHVATSDEIVRIANAYPPPEFAKLVPVVITAAAEGDALAQAVLSGAGMELARLARIVMRHLWPVEKPTRVALCGGVFANAELVRQVFENALHAERPEALVIDAPVRPVLGALALARKQRKAVSQ